MSRSEHSAIAWFLITLAATTIISVGLEGCRKQSQVVSSPDVSATPNTITSSSPPFKTREPDRYRATRITTAVRTDPGDNGPQSVTQTTTVWIARDGAMRREEYELDSRERLIYLTNAKGTFVLWPSQKIFADLAGEGLAGLVLNNIDSSNSDLLKEAVGESTYEALGEERISDRQTIKFRVTSGGNANLSTTRQETLIWVDKMLGMPIHSETRISEGGSSSSITMDLRDFAQDVDARSFELPADYRKVDRETIIERIRNMRGK